MKPLSLLLFIALFCDAVVAQQPSISQFASETMQSGFLENRGQVRGFDNKPVDFVYYQANIGGQQVFVTKYGLSLLLSRTKRVNRIAGVQGTKLKSATATPSDSVLVVDYELERIDIVLKNGSIKRENITTTANAASPAFNLYFDEYNTNGQGLRLQNEILIKNVYPGIDWKIYIREQKGKPSSLKYDFIVHPGADPSLIRLRYSENAKIQVSGNEVNGQAKMGLIKEEKPYSYLDESEREINVSYKVERNTISFKTGGYDKSHTLVIDPSIFWLTYLSTTTNGTRFQSLFGNDVETDGAGNIFVQLSASGNLPFPTANPGGGAYYQDYRASPNGSMIISKFAPGGQMLWSTYFGNWVGGERMTIDKFDNIVAVGEVLNSTPDFPNPAPVIPLVNSGGFFKATAKKYFIARFSNTGKLTWSSWYLNFESYPMDMTYDINGNIYVVGWSTSYDFPAVDPGGGAYALTTYRFAHAQVLFISQFNAADQLTWSTRIEGNDYDPGVRVCTDKVGNIYIGGKTRSSNYPLVDAGKYFNNVSWGSVITRFNHAGKMTWSTYFPGPYALHDLTTDDSCNLYVVIDKRIVKFDSTTEKIFETSVPSTRMHSWRKIEYDRVHDQFQLLGIMNDFYFGFPTINTACKGDFFHDGQFPRKFNSATGPIFATIDHAGNFSYRSLADWPAEYYEDGEFSVDAYGDVVYLFGHNTGGYSYPNPDLTNPGNGAYFDKICCGGTYADVASLLLKLTSSEISVTTDVISPSGCNCDGIITITPQCGTPPFSYEWNNGATTASVSGLCPGNYSVKITDAKFLSKQVKVIVPYPPGSITSFSRMITPENCDRANGTIAIQTVQGGVSPYSYSIDGITYQSSPLFNSLDSGSYIIRVKDNNGCVFNDTVVISRITGPTAVSLNIVESSCVADDGKIQINQIQGGVGPFQFSLSGSGTNSTGVFANLAANNYQLLISDAAGCQLSTSVVVTKAVPPVDASVNFTNDHCNQGIGSIQVTNVTGGVGPFAFSLDSVSFTVGTINHIKAGSYSLFVKDANGCVLKKAPVVVGDEPGPVGVSFNIKHAYCGKLTGDIEVTATQGGSAPFKYSLGGTSYSTSGSFSGLQPGNHELYVKDAFGCVLSKKFVVEYTPVAKINLVPVDTTLCYGETVSLNVTGDTNQLNKITWNIPGQNFSANFKVNQDKKVFVSIVDRNNCTIRDTATVHVKACNPPEKCIAIPSAFTPNHDGKNEILVPITNGCRVESIQFKIFNRWGELIFATDKAGDGWDGNYKGQPQPAGTYVFVCNYVGDDRVSRQYKGTVTLLR